MCQYGSMSFEQIFDYNIIISFQKWLEDQEKIRMEQLEKLGINEDDIGVDVIKSSHKDPGVKPPGPGQPPKAPEEKGKDFNLKIFLKKFFPSNRIRQVNTGF